MIGDERDLFGRHVLEERRHAAAAFQNDFQQGFGGAVHQRIAGEGRIDAGHPFALGLMAGRAIVAIERRGGGLIEVGTHLRLGRRCCWGGRCGRRGLIRLRSRFRAATACQRQRRTCRQNCRTVAHRRHHPRPCHPIASPACGSVPSSSTPIRSPPPSSRSAPGSYAFPTGTTGLRLPAAVSAWCPDFPATSSPTRSG